MSRSILTPKRIALGLGAIALLIFAGFVFISLVEARQAVFETVCVHNLKLIGLPLRMYAEEHENRLPEKLSDLYPEYLTDPRCLICPNLRKHHKKTTGKEYPFSDPPTPEEIDTHCSYVYVPGYSLDDDKDTVVAYEKVDKHHGRGRALLYLDTRAFRKRPEDWPTTTPEAL